MYLRRFFAIPAVFFLVFEAHSQVVINEVMSSNGSTLYDEDGSAPDWIELWNTSNQVIDLNGYALSDKPSQPFKWTFPSYNMQPGQFLVVFASDKDRRTPTLFYETILRQGDTCRYIVPGASTSSAWREPDFDDSGWNSGTSGFGYGDGDDATVLPQGTLSVFLRKTFYVEDPSLIKDCWMHMDYDDGFVAYLNGKEIARAGIGVPGVPPIWNALANSVSHEAVLYQGGMPEAFHVPLDSTVFRAGWNVLAIQVHNTNTTSSDLSAIPFFTLGYSSPVKSPRGIAPETGLHNPSFHTNFKLSSAGDTVILSSPQGIAMDQLALGSLPRDISAGKQPDGVPGYWLFTRPTPGSSNTTQAFPPGALREISFSQPGGFVSAPFQLSITGVQQDDSVYYTLSGSEPTSKDSLYKHPIQITKTTTVRARLLNKNYISGNTITATYIFKTNPTLPAVELTTDSANLFDWNYGIYEMGPNASADFPYFGANFWQDWERPVYIELFETDTSRKFSAPGGIKIYGNYSRGLPQKSFALYARASYGAKAFNYPLFPNLPFTEYQAFVLRNSGNDWNISHFRDALMTSLVAETGLDLQAYRPVSVYINGYYWGILNLREKINEHFLAAHHKEVDPNQIDMLEFDGQVIQGDADHYVQLMNFLNSHSLTSQENYLVVKGMIDIDNYINYQASQIYFNNWDWPGNNLKYWRPKTGGGKWRWILYDTDFGFGLWDVNKYLDNTLEFALATDGPSWPNPPWSTFLFRKLVQNEEFKTAFVNRFADMLNSLFAYSRVVSFIDKYHNALKNEMQNHFDRWGGYMYNWNAEVNNLRTFAYNRPNWQRYHIKKQFAPSGFDSLKVTVNDASAGIIRVNTLLIKTFPWSGIYFKDFAVPISALPSQGYRFVRWEGPVDNANSSVTSIKISGYTSIKAIFEQDDSSGSSVVINEINYHSTANMNTDDWIELFNISQQTVDISGWYIHDSDTSHRFTIPAGTSIPARGFQVICRNMTAFSAIHPGITGITGNMSFGLSCQGDCIYLYNALHNLVDSVCYGVEYPWPEEPDGAGPTLELTNPTSNNTLAENWNASSITGGTPGKCNSNTPVWVEENESGNPVLKEVFPNPATDHMLIRFALPQKTYVRLTVSDMQGRMVAVLINEEYQPGEHESMWIPSAGGGKPLPGVYLICLETPQHKLYQKAVLIKE